MVDAIKKREQEHNIVEANGIAEEKATPHGTQPQPALSFEQRYQRIASLLTTGYLVALFLGLPLVFSNYYFNITETKQFYFLILSGIYLLLTLLARIALPPDYGVRRAKISLHLAAIALIALFVVSVTGSLLSRYPNEAFFGENNRYQGLLTLFCYACLAVTLSRREIALRWPEIAFLAGASLVSIFGVLHHFGVDPIGFTQDLRASDRGRFLSTIGNADFYASYIAMAFAVSLGYVLRARKKSEIAFSVPTLIMVSFGTLVAGSDSAALGVLVLCAVSPLLLFSDVRAVKRLPLGIGVFFLCAFFFGLLSAALPNATYLSAFFSALSRPVFSLPLAMLMVLFWFLLSRATQPQISRLKAGYLAVLLGAVLLGIIVLILLNTALRQLPLGDAERYLRFSESWGTDRGKIWTFVAKVYANQPFAQKLFGASSGALFHADAVHPIFPDAGLDTAHNEYLQYLLTNGALGLSCYLIALALALRAGIKRSIEEPVYHGLTLAVIAYAAQATVNIAQPLTTPILFVLLGILISQKKRPLPKEDLPL